MARKATGQVIERKGKRGTTFSIRFTAYGKRYSQRLGTAQEGWTWEKAEEELGNVMADVRRGIWRPPTPEPTPEPKVEPTFHEFASRWLAQQHDLRERTVADYKWALSNHLLPFFAAHKLREITAEEIDSYTASKVREREERLVERPLSNTSINKTITRLAQIMEVAVEYGYADRNHARSKRRRLKPQEPRRASLTAEQVGALLDAAAELDQEDGRGSRHRRPLLLTAITGGGQRVSELTALRRRDLDLANGTIKIGESKTDAGKRKVDLSPWLREELTLYIASRDLAPDDYLFPGRGGRRRDRNAVRERVFYAAVERANERLAEAGRPLISSDATFHSLRRTTATLLAQANSDPKYMAKQIGHTDSTFTLNVYTDANERRDDVLARVDQLINDADAARKRSAAR